jgi:hypothetical protein
MNWNEANDKVHKLESDHALAKEQAKAERTELRATRQRLKDVLEAQKILQGSDYSPALTSCKNSRPVWGPRKSR